MRFLAGSHGHGVGENPAGIQGKGPEESGGKEEPVEEGLAAWLIHAVFTLHSDSDANALNPNSIGRGLFTPFLCFDLLIGQSFSLNFELKTLSICHD